MPTSVDSDDSAITVVFVGSSSTGSVNKDDNISGRSRSGHLDPVSGTTTPKPHDHPTLSKSAQPKSAGIGGASPALLAKYRSIWGPNAEIYFDELEYARSLLRYSAVPVIAVIAGQGQPIRKLLDFTLFTLPSDGNVVVVEGDENSVLHDCPQHTALCSQYGATDRYDGVVWTEPGVRPAAADKALEQAKWSDAHFPEKIAARIGNLHAHYLPCTPVPYLFKSRVSIGDIVDEQRLRAIAKDVSSASFDSHKYTADELVAVSYILLKGVMGLPGLEDLALPDDELVWFLLVLRACYSPQTPYHNFVHVVDVLQATVFILERDGKLPTFNIMLSKFINNGQETAIGTVDDGHNDASESDSGYSDFGTDSSEDIVAIASLVVAAPGHDVFHPGINTKLILAMDKSGDYDSLEKYHADVYLQVLKLLWPAMANDRAGTIVREVILATDMARHGEYLDAKVTEQGAESVCGLNFAKPSDGPSSSTLKAFSSEKQRMQLCRVLKCADIFNVARPFPVSYSHSLAINLEMDCQTEIEEILHTTATFCPGLPTNPLERIRARQEFFTNVFAVPLFNVMERNGMPFLKQMLDKASAEWNQYWEHPQELEAEATGCCC